MGGLISGGDPGGGSRGGGLTSGIKKVFRNEQMTNRLRLIYSAIQTHFSFTYVFRL